MGKSAWSCSKHEKISFHRGAWTASEDRILSEYIKTHGAGGWGSLPKKAGLTRCGKSCRLRWLNYLRPDIKRGSISPEEDDLLIRLHRLLGNRWALIAGRLPGRTDNEIKNYWNTHLSKRVQLGEIQPKCWKPLNRSWDVPSYSNYAEEGVVHKDISTSQNTAVKPTAVRYCGKAAADVDILDCINQEGLKAVDKDVDILDCINQDGLKAVDIFYCINQEGLKAVDNDVLEINTSKSWCQLLLEDSTGHYEHDRFQPNSMISTSCRADEHHQFPSPSLGGSIILQENQSSSSNIFDPEFPHPKDFNSSYFDSFLDLGELSILLP